MEPADATSRDVMTWPAWLVHAFTAIGAVLGLLALQAIIAGDVRLALVWLVLALAIDGIDGTLARLLRVKERLPRIDGAVLDLIIDYLNYVFVPTVLMWRAGLVPAALAPWLAALIQLSALYVFARRDMKTADNYFRGFPALWNVVAFYLWVAQPGAAAGAVVVAALAAASFAPIHFVHPFRCPDFGRWPPLIALVWTAATTALLWPGLGEATAQLLLGISAAAAALLVLVGLVRTVKGRRASPPGPAGPDASPADP